MSSFDKLITNFLPNIAIDTQTKLLVLLRVLDVRHQKFALHKKSLISCAKQNFIVMGLASKQPSFI
jgi:hypothetical protein